MTLLDYALILFGLQFAHVFLAAFQQRSVTLDKDWAVPPVSYLLSAAKVLEVSLLAGNVMQNGFGWELGLLIFVMGTAGWLASLTAMRTHRRIFL